ncbi:MAG: hypothetical protein M1827_003280 [Pycnora praestabilis]|nr:MAG: hypothetical protein M1827_003280 [Pycnora praestabilis]
MTAQILTSELANLIQDSKRKNSELRNAAEKSLSDLKALPSTSETQLAAGLDVQLKILQALPPLLQNYADDLRGELLESTLHVCSTLQVSKNGIVSNTAAATLQQLVVSVFDQVVIEDKSTSDDSTVTKVPTQDGDVPARAAALDAYKVFNDLCLLTKGQKPQYLRFAPMPQGSCLELIESILSNNGDIFLSHPEQANVLRVHLMPFLIKFLSEKSIFPTTVRVNRVLCVILKQHLDILRSECETALNLLTQMLDADSSASWKRALSMEIFRGIYAEPGLIRKIYAAYDEQDGKRSIVRDHMAALVRLSAEKPAVIGLSHQSTIPTSQSNLTDTSGELAAMEASGVAGIVTGAVGMSDANTPGISVQWSSMRVPCIDQLDKADPPSLPSSYIYSLALTCINSFSEGLAKFILPLTVPSEMKGKRRNRTVTVMEGGDTTRHGTESTSLEESPRKDFPNTQQFKKSQTSINPLSLESHPLYEDIRICAAIIETCWPAVLATCSTFLNASLDSDYYHSLIRTFQKFTHVSGLLQLRTPRDAFLTTLGKSAVPSNIFTPNIHTGPLTPSSEGQSMFANAKGLLSVDSLVSQTSTTSSERNRLPPSDVTQASLNTRNLLCLRALLNLGIALGPTLEKAWSIVLETLQQADFVVFSTTKRTGRQNSYSQQKGDAQSMASDPSSQANYGSEFSAVEIAASRLFESTSDFPNESFVDVLTALCKLLGDTKDSVSGMIVEPPKSPMPGLNSPIQPHRRVSSISGVSTFTASQMQEGQFTLAKISDLASINMSRLTSSKPSESGWETIITQLVRVACSSRTSSSVRLKAADVLNAMVIHAVTFTSSKNLETRTKVQRQVLEALGFHVYSLYQRDQEHSVAAHGVDVEIHRTALEALRSLVEQCGDSLVAGWDLVFDVIGSVFDEKDSHRPVKYSHDKQLVTLQYGVHAKSPKLVRSAFGSLQLICSDFLSTLPNSCVLTLVDVLSAFCSQVEDFNISLTTITFFWNTSDFLQGRDDAFLLDKQVLTARSEDDLHDLGKGTDDHDSSGALWMLLLLRLTAASTDQRSEVRNGAIQTVLRIFDAYGDHLTSEAWGYCLRMVFFRMMSANVALRNDFKGLAGAADTEQSKAENETSIVLLNGVSALLASYLDTLIRQSDFATSWRQLMRLFDDYLDARSSEVSAAVFTALRNILMKVNTTAKLERSCIKLVWQLWERDIQVSRSWQQQSQSSTQDALLSYVQLLQELYPLIEIDITAAQIDRILGNLRECILRSQCASYSKDIDYLIPLHAQVIEVLRKVRSNMSGVPSALVFCLADFIKLAFHTDSIPESGAGRPTFVALSKASMQASRDLLIQHINNQEIYISGALLTSIDALAEPISLKYQWRTEGRDPPTWKLATCMSLEILKKALPALTKVSPDDANLIKFWERAVKVIGCIVAADCSKTPPSANVGADEEFDINIFNQLRNFIIPALGDTIIPDNMRRTHAESIFAASIIHTPEPNEIPIPGSELLEGLYNRRTGRTYNPQPARRTKMSYVCLDELFALVRVHDGTVERVKLAQAAAPYLILRAGLTLRGYIYDQPLRGLMPQPFTQRKELLYVLRALIALDCEPKAIPDAPGVVAQHKKHLHRLFPLVTKAVGVAGRDPEVLGELRKVLEVVGEGFGV